MRENLDISKIYNIFQKRGVIMAKDKGLIHIYCGENKGKTSMCRAYC